MDYKGFVKGSYSYDLDSYFNSHSGQTMAFVYGSNQVAFVDNDALNPNLTGFDELCYYTCSQLRVNGYDKPVAFLYPSLESDYFYFVGSQYLDYAIFSITDYSLDVLGLKATSDNHWVEDLDLLQNYGNLTQRDEPFASGYSSYQYNDITTSVVFDYSNLHYDNSSYNVDMLPIRGENISFYYSIVRINFDNLGLFTFEYGRPIGDAREQGYSTGYSVGFQGGWVQGNENGYQIGINQNGNVGQGTATAFNYIGNAFGAVANIMSLEVLPNITIGLAFSIPMVFVLIMTIFKLVRK